MSYCFLQDIGVDVGSMDKPPQQPLMGLPKLDGTARSQSTGALAGANLTASLHRNNGRRSSSSSRPGSGTTKTAGRQSCPGSPNIMQFARTLPLELQMKAGRKVDKANARFSGVAASAEWRAPETLEGLPAVLFLDVDGVLHSVNITHQRQQFAAQCMKLLKDIIAKTQARIVLSTAWREHPDGRRMVAEKLREYDIPVFVSQTPSIARFRRTREILTWVRKYKPTSWVAVDDLPLLQEDPDNMTGHFVQTRQFYGLQPASADKIVEFFRLQKLKAEEASNEPN